MQTIWSYHLCLIWEAECVYLLIASNKNLFVPQSGSPVVLKYYLFQN